MQALAGSDSSWRRILQALSSIEQGWEIDCEIAFAVLPRIIFGLGLNLDIATWKLGEVLDAKTLNCGNQM